jgi:hypothetical protein
MRSMPQRRRTLRLVIQRVGDAHHPAFHVIAFGEAGGNACAEFSTLSALLNVPDTAVRDVVLDLCADQTLVFTRRLQYGRGPYIPSCQSIAEKPCR